MLFSFVYGCSYEEYEADTHGPTYYAGDLFWGFYWWSLFLEYCELDVAVDCDRVVALGSAGECEALGAGSQGEVLRKYVILLFSYDSDDTRATRDDIRYSFYTQS